MDLYLLKYNNYFNRQVKYESTLSGYNPYKVAVQSNVNFKLNNRVNTIQIVNCSIEDVVPDYLIAAIGNTIKSRWFIIDCTEIRKGQYSLTLRRDVIVDNINYVKTAPTYIEKATLKDTDPLIFNDEGMSFNQIKKAEVLLKDNTETPWIVGYFSTTGLEDKAEVTVSADITYDEAYASSDLFPYNQYFQVPAIIDTSNSKFVKDIREPTALAQAEYTSYKVSFDESGYNTIKNSGLTTEAQTPLGYAYGGLNTSATITEDNNYLVSKCVNLQEQTKSTFASPSLENTLRGYNGKIIRIGTSVSNYRYFRVSTNMNTENKVNVVTNGTLFTTYKNCTNNANKFTGTALDTSVTVSYIAKTIKLESNEITQTITTTMMDTRQRLSDAPYCMFAMPYNNFDVYDGTHQFMSSDTAQRMAYAIANNFGGEHLYDLQLLPYCPFEMTKVLVGTYAYKFPSTVQIQYFTKQANGSNLGNCGYLFWCNKSSFTRNINYSIPVTDAKIEAETEFVRLNSPNYAASFDFSPAKNGGVNKFNIDCTYKPYTPYIHVNPDFGGIYGLDFNDARGLICNGDFSMPIATDAFATYELQNKNYENTFNRQIDSMEMKNKYSKVQDIANIVTGTLQAGATGLGVGMMLGGPVGASAGATIGAIGSATAGITDVVINDKLRREDINLARDNYVYGLGNIKARADTITKVGVVNENYKYFPFLEFYSATDREKQMLKDKIKYEGMTVNAIGYIQDYIQAEPTYIRGTIIRIDPNAQDDYLMTKAITEELSKGVYI